MYGVRAIDHLSAVWTTMAECVTAVYQNKLCVSADNGEQRRSHRASCLTLNSDLYMYPSHTLSLLPDQSSPMPLSKKGLHKGFISPLHPTTWHTIKTPPFTGWQIAVEGDHIHPDLNVQLQLALSASSNILL